MKKCFDLVIVGGGIVGVALGREMKMRFPAMTMAIIEKESAVAVHQTGHNSGVVHAGIYYKPGSLKAQLCVSGMKKAYKYFDEKQIPYKKCGKLIVATSKDQINKLDDLYTNSLKNGVDSVRMIAQNQIKEVEPCCEGLKALHSPETGIVDWGLVTQYYSKDFESLGGKMIYSFEVVALSENNEGPDPSQTTSNFPVKITGKNKETVHAGYVCTCGGLYADKLATMTGCSVNPVIVPIRGEYLKLTKEKEHLVKGNIYPVPNPALPFLGVHFTPRMDGSIWIGPNAVLAFAREGYRLIKPFMEVLRKIYGPYKLYHAYQRGVLAFTLFFAAMREENFRLLIKKLKSLGVDNRTLDFLKSIRNNRQVKSSFRVLLWLNQAFFLYRNLDVSICALIALIKVYKMIDVQLLAEKLKFCGFEDDVVKKFTDLLTNNNNSSWTDVNLSEFKETLLHPSFQKLALKYFGFGTSEMVKSINLRFQVKELQKFIPDIKVEDISRGPTGVRAQALDVNGEFVDDFFFDAAKDAMLFERVMHCRNAPSPAATSSLAIAEYLATELQRRFMF